MNKIEFLGLVFMLTFAPIAAVFAAIAALETGHWIWIVSLIGAVASFIGGWVSLAIEFINSEV
jgi:hypothetical protein